MLGAQTPTSTSIRFNWSFDAHYARYFASSPSAWTLHLTDELLADLRAQGLVDVLVDGMVQSVVDPNTYFSERQIVTVPAGTGAHNVTYRKH